MHPLPGSQPALVQLLQAQAQHSRPNSCRPCLPSLLPQDLVEACLQDDHTQRPSFAAIEARLAALLENYA